VRDLFSFYQSTPQNSIPLHNPGILHNLVASARSGIPARSHSFLRLTRHAMVMFVLETMFSVLRFITCSEVMGSRGSLLLFRALKFILLYLSLFHSYPIFGALMFCWKILFFSKIRRFCEIGFSGTGAETFTPRF